jgi:hypothetical protein
MTAVRSSVGGVSKTLGDGLATVVEDSLEIAADEKSAREPAERPQRDRVADTIVNDGGGRRVPGRIVTSAGVVTSKWSQGGVIGSKLRAST